jgi:hypothetical protein
VVHKVRNFIDGFSLIVSLACDYNLGTLLTDFFKNLISTLTEQIGGVRALGKVSFSAL